MDKFDILEHFYNNIITEQGEEELEPQQQQQQFDPNQQQAQQQPQEPTPQQNAQVVDSVSSPFDQFTGNTIGNMQFQPHENGGSITIDIQGSNLPVVISWTGSRVTLKHKDIVPLT